MRAGHQHLNKPINQNKKIDHLDQSLYQYWSLQHRRKVKQNPDGVTHHYSHAMCQVIASVS